MEGREERHPVAIASAGAAHDLANLLAVIGGTAAMLADDLDHSALDRAAAGGAREHVERIASCVEAACELIERLPGRTGRAPRIEPPSGGFALSGTLAEALGLVRPLVPHPVAFEASLPPSLAGGPDRARGTPLDMIQLVLNLVLNARDAVARSQAAAPRIMVTAHVGVPAPAPAPVVGTIDPGRTLASIAVSDTGPGLDPGEIATRVAHWPADASGVPGLDVPGLAGRDREREGPDRAGPRGWGLRIVADIVRRTGGALRVGPPGGGASGGTGTTVEVLWPLEPARAIPDLTGRLVLLIAGAPGPTGGLARAFEEAGAEVALCLDAGDAAQSLAEDHGEWDVVLIAGDAPRTGASEAARRLRAADPHVPLVVWGGDAGADMDGDRTRMLGADARPLDALRAAMGLVDAERAR